MFFQTNRNHQHAKHHDIIDEKDVNAVIKHVVQFKFNPFFTLNQCIPAFKMRSRDSLIDVIK